MNDIRAKFEEIWPVPEGVYWMPLSRNGGEYMADPSLSKDNREEAQFAAEEWDARLDTFTRCQETTDLYVGLIEEMIADLMITHDTGFSASDWVNRANKAMGKLK
jgi:hypothetical protein